MNEDVQELIAAIQESNLNDTSKERICQAIVKISTPKVTTLPKETGDANPISKSVQKRIEVQKKGRGRK